MKKEGDGDLSENNGPQLAELEMIETRSCEPRMTSTKKDKTIIEISSFQKIYFCHGFEISKIVSRFVLKRQFYPPWAKTWVFGLRT